MKISSVGILDLHWIYNMLTMLLAAVTVVSPLMGADGWPFASVDSYPGAEVDPLYASKHVRDLYFRADPNYQGRYAHSHSTPPT